jgi:hypothetical protein
MSVRIGIGVDVFRGGGLSAEALAWQTNIIANGGTIPSATLTIFDEVFFKPATANGNILSELDRLNIYCGLNGYEIAARTNIISSSFFVTPVSSPTFDNNGYKSSGTSYLDLNYNPNTQGVKLTLNSVSQGVVFKNPVYTGTKRSMGGSNGVSSQRLCVFVSDGGATASALNNSTFGVSNTCNPIGYVHLIGKRTAALVNLIDINGTQTTNTVVSTAVPNFNVYELTENQANTVGGDFDTNYHLASYHGSKDLDNASLRTILNNLFTALGV